MCHVFISTFTRNVSVAIVSDMNSEYQIKNPSDFQEVINDILNWYQESGQETLVITLQGDLGAGKTTFTQTLGKHLKIEEQITSPTFTIMKKYLIDDEQFEQLVHIDAYRIESEDEVGPLRLKEIIEQPRKIICIEWPERIATVIPDSAVQIAIEIGEGEIRTVKMSQNSLG